jgi:23S rRNA pseudouridine2605 synthase
LKVNGCVVHDPDQWIRPATDVIHLDGKRLKQVRRVYLVLNKPKGVITSHGDPQGRKTIYDLLEKNLAWVSPVGRLDQDTSGLLLLTNDTDFANHVTDPASGVEKTYLVKLSGLAGEESLRKLEAGIEMKRGDFARPESVRRMEDRGKYSWLEVVLTEGKNREVRRMIEAVGFQVLKLVRIRIDTLTLAGLEVGKYRELTGPEITSLRRRRRKNREI